MPDNDRHIADLALLHPVVREKVRAVQAQLDAEGIPLRVFESFRTPDRQNYLYAKGRTASGRIVTYARAWGSYHQYGCAADFVFHENGQWNWGGDAQHSRWYRRLHEIGRANGLEPLEFETPHLQLMGTNIGALQAGRYPEGGDASWADNLSAAIRGWSGTPAAPPVPAAAAGAVVDRPPLDEVGRAEEEENGPLQSALLASDTELQNAAMSLRDPFSRGGARSESVGLIQDALDTVLPAPERILAGADRGRFGPRTEAAVRRFQAGAGLVADGLVGRNTLRALDRALQALTGGPAPQPQPQPPAPVPGNLGQILQIAENSAIASYHWNNRGVAPIGYTKGMAAVFGRIYCKLKAGDPAAVEMARADKNAPYTDALSHYQARFNAVGMDNDEDGAETLRHLFVLLLGLGMRESSGAYCEGRDITNPNSNTASSAEAGLFQTSWNARTASLLLPQLFQTYSANPDSGFVEIFREQVSCSTADWRTIGTGTGAAFQELSKKCPAFATEFAGVGLRNVRRHWGPINNFAAEIRPEADAMLKRVQDAIDSAGLCPVLL